MAKPLPTPPTAEIRKSRSNSPKKAQKTNLSPNKNQNNEKNVPRSNGRTKNEHNSMDDEEFEFFHQFSREKVKGVIHVITAELKEKGPDVEFLMIPFRPEQTNDKLLTLLNQLFPLGNGQPVNEKKTAQNCFQGRCLDFISMLKIHLVQTSKFRNHRLEILFGV
ncbi:CEL_1a_G0050900.mRNA.1.CDS.1 [Saccharomyces cerevisiae]|nr:CEL_1a_G0050900.mRNA.1.CDS.1 [Saccharomyces cerevisiae]CAI7464718.1 CEL_1a_G0050900.mRNA.1.CDS.1 [Saccharomyces cerevisiae]